MKRNFSWITLITTLAIAFGCLTLISCDSGGDDDDDDSGGDDEDIDDVPDGVNDFLDNEDIQALIDVGMVVYTGSNPPNVEGTYALDSLYITYDDAGQSNSIMYYEITFSNQTDDGEIEVNFEASGDTGGGVGAFIAGDGQCFTIFDDVTGHTDADSCDYEMPMLFSGCMVTDGIQDFMIGLIMKNREGDCSMTIPVDHKRIIEETDGLAAEI